MVEIVGEVVGGKEEEEKERISPRKQQFVQLGCGQRAGEPNSRDQIIRRGLGRRGKSTHYSNILDQLTRTQEN